MYVYLYLLHIEYQNSHSTSKVFVWSSQPFAHYTFSYCYQLKHSFVAALKECLRLSAALHGSEDNMFSAAGLVFM